MPPSKPVSLGLYGLAAFLIIAGTWVWYYPHIEDDALISARYAMRLVEGKGLSWNDGYFVEGYSNLSWVVMTAGLMKLGISPFAAVRILGGAVTLITLAAFVVVGLRAARGHTLGTVFVLVCATLHAPIINALGGLEAPLIFAGVYFAARALIRWWEDGSPKWLFLASLALAVLCITRPDGPLFTAIAGLSLLLAWTTPQYFLRQTAILFTLPIAFTLGQLIYRQMTYDAWVPNTARVKLDAGSNALSEGMNYIASAALANIVLILPILITLLVRPKNFPKITIVLGAMAITWSAYIVFIGGDIFFGYRHFLPVLGVALALVPATIGAWHNIKLSLPIAAAAGLLAFGSQFYVPFYKDADHTKWIWRCVALAEELKVHYDDVDPLIGVTAAGCLPLVTGYETVDLLGLNDLELPDLVTQTGEDYQLGHRLGNLEYLLRRAPEIVIFNTGSKLDFAYKDQAATNPAFDATYCETEHVIPTYFVPATLYLHREFAAQRPETPICLNDRS